MNVTRPCSTNGRNASCCALLKRCTSSTNRIVCRPDCASVASARATASRMSLTPDSTAESAMNSALNASAISRASVVLPTPGRSPQDHRVRLARRERDGERLARREQMPLADHLVDRRRAQALGERRGGIGGGEKVGHGNANSCGRPSAGPALTRRNDARVHWTPCRRNYPTFPEACMAAASTLLVLAMRRRGGARRVRVRRAIRRLGLPPRLPARSAGASTRASPSLRWRSSRSWSPTCAHGPRREPRRALVSARGRVPFPRCWFAEGDARSADQRHHDGHRQSPDVRRRSSRCARARPVADGLSRRRRRRASSVAPIPTSSRVELAAAARRGVRARARHREAASGGRSSRPIPPRGRIEATATTPWFGFQDDVVIRVTPRTGRQPRRHPLAVARRPGRPGTNAKRIRAFLAKLAS